MKIIRFKQGNSNLKYGWIYNDKVGELTGPPFGSFRRLDAVIPYDEVRLAAPVLPGKIIAVGRNYPEHAREHEVGIPDVPLIFLKPPTSVIGPGEKILLPPQSQQVEHEAEIAVVISREGRWIPLEKAMDYVLGYTVGNDVTARDLQRRDGQWTRGKGFDTFCPIGPVIETDVDPSDLLITCRVNGEIRQMSSTREMVFSIPQLIVYISSVMTLMPGDILLTGTPAGVGKLTAGDTIDIEIEGIGILKNIVEAEPHL